MKRITVTLTDGQARHIARIYGNSDWVQNSDYPKSDPQNAFAQRIADKMLKALARLS